MRISDWSSDVCSSDLEGPYADRRPQGNVEPVRHQELADDVRSEEHTSELQSLMRISYAVFCLKKKNTQNKTTKLNLKITRNNTHNNKKTDKDNKMRKIETKVKMNNTEYDKTKM